MGIFSSRAEFSGTAETTPKMGIRDGLEELRQILGRYISFQEAFVQLQLEINVDPRKSLRLKKLNKRCPRLLMYLTQINHNGRRCNTGHENIEVLLLSDCLSDISLKKDQETSLIHGLEELQRILGKKVTVNQAYTQLQLEQDADMEKSQKLRELNRICPKLLDILWQVNIIRPKNYTVADYLEEFPVK